MYSLNKVQIIGNLTANPEVRETPNGQKVANFSVATNRSWKDAAGMKQDQSEFHNIVAWGFLADLAEKYFTKGKKIYVEGRLQTRSWEDQTGQKKYRTEIIAENCIMLSGGPSESTESYGGAPDMDVPEEISSPTVKRTAQKKEQEIDIKDIPF